MKSSDSLLKKQVYLEGNVHILQIHPPYIHNPCKKSVIHRNRGQRVRRASSEGSSGHPEPWLEDGRAHLHRPGQSRGGRPNVPRAVPVRRRHPRGQHLHAQRPASVEVGWFARFKTDPVFFVLVTRTVFVVEQTRSAAMVAGNVSGVNGRWILRAPGRQLVGSADVPERRTAFKSGPVLTSLARFTNQPRFTGFHQVVEDGFVAQDFAESTGAAAGRRDGAPGTGRPGTQRRSGPSRGHLSAHWAARTGAADLPTRSPLRQSHRTGPDSLSWR